jgi:hypothetical protein
LGKPSWTTGLGKNLDWQAICTIPGEPEFTGWKGKLWGDLGSYPTGECDLM